MTDVIIRPLVASDTPAAVALLHFLNPDCTQDVLLSRYETMLRDHPHFHVVGALVDDRLVGLAGVWTATKIWCGRHVEIDNLIVHPDHRTGGIGSALFRYIEDYARRQGASCLTLDSYAANRASHRLYYRQGFEIWSFHFVKPVGNIHA